LPARGHSHPGASDPPAADRALLASDRRGSPGDRGRGRGGPARPRRRERPHPDHQARHGRQAPEPADDDRDLRVPVPRRRARDSAAEAEQAQRDVVAENRRTSNHKPAMRAKPRSRKKKTETSESSSGDDDTATKAYDKAYIHENDVNDEEADTEVIETEPKLKPGQRRPTKAEREMAALKKTIGMDDEKGDRKSTRL